MKKTIEVGTKKIVLESNAFTPLAYKKQFNKDFFQELFAIAKAFQGKKSFSFDNLSDESIKAFDTELFYRFFWIFAFTANPEVPSFLEFYSEYSDLTFEDIVVGIVSLIEASFVTKKKVDSSDNASEETFTVETFILCCKESGLSIDELKYLTVGGALDFQTDYVNLHSQSKNETKTRKATQEDIDNF